MPASPSQEAPSVKAENRRDQPPKKVKDRLGELLTKASPLVKINFSWFLLSLPVVTIFPALGGLYHAILSFNQQETPGSDSAWDGFKNFWWLSLQWGLTVLLVIAALGSALWFFNTLNQSWATYASATAGALLFLWTAINQFSLPLLFMQEEKRVGVAIRNGYVVAVRRPLIALKTLLLTIIIAALGTLLAPSWVLITMALIAHIQTRTALKAVATIRSQDADSDAADAHRERFKEVD